MATKKTDKITNKTTGRNTVEDDHAAIVKDIGKKFGKVIDLEREPKVMVEIMRQFGDRFGQTKAADGINTGVGTTTGIGADPLKSAGKVTSSKSTGKAAGSKKSNDGVSFTDGIGSSDGIGGSDDDGVGMIGSGGVSGGDGIGGGEGVSGAGRLISEKMNNSVFDPVKNSDILKTVLKLQSQLNKVSKQVDSLNAKNLNAKKGK